MPTTPAVTVHLCIPEDQRMHAPKRRRAPTPVPASVPLPRIGEVVYLSSTTAWQVSGLTHEWRSSVELRIEVWLDYIGPARFGRPPEFATTQ